MEPIQAIELVARREALGFSKQEMAAYLGIHQPNYSNMEQGKRAFPFGALSEIMRLEQIVDDLVDRMVELVEQVVEQGQEPALVTHATDQSFWAAHPEHDGLPARLHRIACARAASELAGPAFAVPIIEKS